MIQLFKKKILQHQSFFVLMLGAVSFFSTNIILKEKITRIEYGQYSLLLTYLTMIYIYGMLGLEQVLVKYSYIENRSIIRINIYNFWLILTSIIISTIFSVSFFLSFYGEIPLNPFILILTTLSMVGMLYVFSIFRLNSNFVIAQLLINCFKIILFVFVLFFFLIDKFFLKEILLIISLSIIISFITGIIILKQKLQVIFVKDASLKTILIASYLFFISTITFSLINFGDRYIIDYRYGIETLGDYFYLSNFFLTPFMIMQGYLGFKKLADYKNAFTVKSFNRDNINNLIIGLLICFFLIVLYKFLVISNILNFDFEHYRNIILLLLLLGIIRVYSSGIYPAFDVVINIINLKKAKILILIMSVIILSLIYFFSTSVEQVIIGFVFIWFIKTFILRYFLLTQITSFED